MSFSYDSAASASAADVSECNLTKSSLDISRIPMITDPAPLLAEPNSGALVLEP